MFAEIARLWLGEIVPTLTRYALFAVGVWATLWILLAAVLRSRKIRDSAPPSRQLATEFLVSLRSMALFATFGVAITLAARAGFYPLADIGTTWGGGWLVASILIGIVAHDAYVYWVHRLMHRPAWFRRTHRRHHRSHNPSPFTAYSFDVNEALLMLGFAVVYPLIFPMHWEAMQWIMLHQIVRNTLLHSGYELRPARADGRPWFDFLTTTTHHDLHHAQAGWNYAAWFTWWDRWMGTEHPEYLARYQKAAGWRPVAGPEAAAAHIR
jgi:sterol desaturase/sphingolipid hydroxylase (fatty acid hydroxylase superfamily)